MMQLFESPLRAFKWYGDIKNKIAGDKVFSAKLTGPSGTDKYHIMDSLSGDGTNVIVVVENDLRAREVLEDFKFFRKDVIYFPPKDMIFYQADINGRSQIIDRMRALKTVTGDKNVSVITTMDALMMPMMRADILKSYTLTLKKGDVAETSALALKLISMGYDRVGQVENPGEFSIRGDIVDIFDITADNPYRLELWGDEIDSVRIFDALSQRSITDIEGDEEISVMPAKELLLTTTQKEEGFHKIQLDAKKAIETFRNKSESEAAFRVQTTLDEMRVELLETEIGINLDSYIHYFFEETGSFLDLFDAKKTVIFLDEPERVMLHGTNVEFEFGESMKNRLEKGYALPGQLSILKSSSEIASRLQKMKLIGISAFVETGDVFSYDELHAVTTRSINAYTKGFIKTAGELDAYRKKGGRIVIVSPSRTRAKRLADDFLDEDVIASYTEDESKILQKGEIYTFYGHLSKGFEYPELNFMVISEYDIFGREKSGKKRKAKYAPGQRISGIDSLKVGDYVIQENHGLGIYRGIEKVEIENIRKDYMKIEYKDGGMLYVLASNFDGVSLYASSDTKQPKLNKLGSAEWNKTKAKVKLAVTDMAKELVELYAHRREKSGHVYGKDTVWQTEFEECFPYEETADQLAAINATKADMESDKIMDRLICGDVGFGKTEVAIRAAFKAVQEGKQVAYLVPTTILAQQHFNTFKERFAPYPIKVAMLSRFCTAKEIKMVTKDLKSGMIDIVIGTHRLLSKDVEFNDLGLLIIDEEQRFGVSHKEKIKQLKETVDVLTLTATPIPRTLHMSLIGIRDLSLLEEPPQDRLPIQTYVMEYNEEMVREAIVRELSRDGQVYYVYNYVNDIERVTESLRKMIPQARIAFAHGQMNESELEVIMMEFVNHEIDVLVSTTIIETGLDIPNVNTMIIHDSDRMGLSQLYQLRGRVGRSNRTSYAFLMYRRNKVLKEVAEKRLSAIKEFTQLGSGYKIAMKDLEIRGAGNVLGKQQHGHMQAVGYELYSRMLEEAVSDAKGEEIKHSQSSTVDLSVDAFIPPSYIVNESQKLDMYKRIAALRTPEDVADMNDELRDRFGDVPREAVNLIRIAEIKQRASDLHINELKGHFGSVRVIMYNDAPVTVENIPVFLNEYGGMLRFKPQGTPEFRLTYEPGVLIEENEELLLEKVTELLDTMKMLYEPVIYS